jgi:hypothetical protein
MSFCLTSTPNKHFFSSDAINLSVSEGVSRHRSISLTSSFKKSSTGIFSFTSNLTSVIQEPNKFTNIKTYSHKSTKNQQHNYYATLPKVSIDLNETLNLKLDEVKDLRFKLKELSKDKIKLINKNYIKVLTNLRETIDTILQNRQEEK